MKRNTIIYALSGLAAFGAVVIAVEANTSWEPPYYFPFLIGYVVLLLGSALYILILFLLSLMKINRAELGRRLLKFIGLFVIFSLGSLVLDEFFKDDGQRVNYGLALGMAFSFSFFDLILSDQKGRNHYEM
ncbi:hypothetical protein [Halobacillus andaensis]|uniref:hypothetical protein n=1 Tax=Halobacillus andaensis TaxID=1176239 RepID=UPI003D7594EB